MTEQPKTDPQVPAGGGEDEELPPPFEPDEDLITYIEKGRDPNGEQR
ncbi:MAG: hypothetical protein ACRDKF_12310 [Actinomycetota bacterium]